MAYIRSNEEWDEKVAADAAAGFPPPRKDAPLLARLETMLAEAEQRLVITGPRGRDGVPFMAQADAASDAIALRRVIGLLVQAKEEPR